METMEEMLEWLGRNCQFVTLWFDGLGAWQCTAIANDGFRCSVRQEDAATGAVRRVYEDINR